MISTMNKYNTFDEWSANAPKEEVKEYLEERDADDILSSEWYHI